MAATIKYFVFENNTFTKVNEPEYSKWHEGEWKKVEPPMFSKLIGGIIYTAQAFYNGDVLKGNRLKPFTIYLIEGNKHKIRYFREWITFRQQYEKLIIRLSKKEIQPPHLSISHKYTPMSVAAMATIRS
jgi:hypothetical protein